MYIARPFGIPLFLHWSFVLGAVVYALFFSSAGLLATLVGIAALFGSVVLHELGHALAARWYGIETAHITLYPFGGVAAIKDIPKEPKAELVIALAGPAVNGVLFAGLLPVYLATGLWWVGALAAINLAMGLFNLIPAFPMDGGRVFRALLSTQMGWFRASHTAIRVGRFFAWGFLGMGLVFDWQLALIGLFLHVALSAEQRRVNAEAWRRPQYRWTPYSYSR